MPEEIGVTRGMLDRPERKEHDVALSAQKIERRLLAHHFFPRIAKRGDEFPPCFVSDAFTPVLVSKLLALRPSRPDGYGVVALRSTRYDLAPRNMEVLHPRAFAKIVRELKSSWNEWKAIESNSSSALRLADHSDGRVFSMIESAHADDLVKPGSRFRAKVDITNFYGSIYTHAIPWAVYGVEAAKTKQGDGADWANRLDGEVRFARRKETTGISIGPGTSAVIGEIMLGAIDHRLRDCGFEFLRFIDDYFFVGSSRDHAEGFVRAVRDELATLKFTIHPGKTKIIELPTPLRPRWMRELRLVQRGGATIGRLLDTLDHALELNEGSDEDGALRYALVTVEEALRSNEIDSDLLVSVVHRLLSIGFLRPVAVGTACRLLAFAGSPVVAELADTLNSMLREHVSNRRTDAATWLLYTLLVNSATIEDQTVSEIVRSGDCMTIALLTCDPAHVPAVKDFITEFERRNPPEYMRDEYWLLYYQLARGGQIHKTVPTGYYEEFRPLLDAKVSFIDLEASHQYLPVHSKPDRGPISGASAGGGGNPYAD